MTLSKGKWLTVTAGMRWLGIQLGRAIAIIAGCCAIFEAAFIVLIRAIARCVGELGVQASHGVYCYLEKVIDSLLIIRR